MPNGLPPLIGVPIKPFGVAKQRLRPRLDAAARSVIGREIAAHTLRTAAATGADVVVVTADAGVASWAADLGFDSLDEGPHHGLDGAVAVLQAAARHNGHRARPWLALHADLPMLTRFDVAALLGGLSETAAVIAPSHDGGTSALGAAHRIETRYGVGSFHGHLRRLQWTSVTTVVARPGLAFDLDTVADLDRLLTAPGAQWIRDRLAAIDSQP
jgi:2-phospho-L-lactate guanylyltransferase